jgi:predicted O-linked N-acetylglucosamine transferase (SPINDLY family)
MNRKTPHHSPSVHPLLPQAVSLHQAGRLSEAAKLYEQIRTQMPRHFDATHLLGVIALQEGRLAEARQLISSALKINPNDPAALNNLGTANLRNGELEAARQCFDRALKLQPGSADALANLGTVLHQMGRFRDAVSPLKRAHAANPGSAAVCNLLGACLLKTGDPRGAAKLFEAAAQAAPDDADGWGNLSVALNAIGEHERALECAEEAVALKSDSQNAVAALAAAQFELGETDAAIATYRRAVALPNPSTQTLCAFANALLDGGLNDEAARQLRRAVELDENDPTARWVLAMAWIKPIYDSETEIETSRKAFAQSLAELKTWFQGVPDVKLYAAVGARQPFFLAYQPFNNRDLLSRYGELCAEWMKSMPGGGTAHSKRSTGAKTAPDRKMRIGIASAHIRDHSVWNAISKGWVHNLDKARFELILFRLGSASDEETEDARREVAHFEDRPENLQEWVRAIKDANLDALIYPEIGMDPLTTQLASLRLAPVQAASWGHAETTGLPTMDLYLSAEVFEPPNAQENYSERLVCLPNIGVYVEPFSISVLDPNVRSLGLPGDEPLLLCPGTPYKYSPAHDRIWARIAKGLPAKKGGRLVFFRGPRGAMSTLLEDRLRTAFKRERADFDARVSVLDNLARPRFFGLMQRSALMLDTFNFSGFNTALQAIECGLPMLTIEGRFMRGRLASGLMRRMGISELVATTDERFVEMAIGLAADLPRRKQLELKLISERKILFRDSEPIRALERCLTDAIATAGRR